MIGKGDCIEGLVEGGVRGLPLSVEELRGRSDDELAVRNVDVEAAETLLAAVEGRGCCRPTGEPGAVELPPFLRSRCWLCLSINLQSALGEAVGKGGLW
ncbi:uncharacterized protein ColSpa_03730 [Colletotrichum spaethianum]|uniref:Uncharacterized protein n=1 Tax=Colletotrichum spaethianum TaxID=700344 RepID=A0AA37P7E9_9PEZI|nr:uncharacterized protein ColSpa_03730 [Colletotrichum spaethianum]GKT43549.1 hypothetical protein ColSpa_03730 [Colletotrichum spaethianum]